MNEILADAQLIYFLINIIRPYSASSFPHKHNLFLALR